MVQKFYVTYNQVHKLCQQSADAILKEFHPNLMIAIGGGGYVPARILRYVRSNPTRLCAHAPRSEAAAGFLVLVQVSIPNVQFSPGIQILPQASR